MPKENEISELLKEFVNDFKTDFFDDKKKYDRLIKLLEGKSPSDIKTIVNNSKSQVIIHEKEVLTYDELLFEIFEFNNHGSFSYDKMIEFLNDNGISQTAIADKMNVSLRQVRNYLNK